VEELFEARTPKYLAEIAPFDAHITHIEKEGDEVKIGLAALEKQTREYYIGEVEMNLLVKKGDTVEAKQIIAKGKESKQKIQAIHAGRVTKITDDVITIEDLTPEVVEYTAPAGRNLLIKEGDTVKIGAKLTEGHVSLQSLMDTAGSLAAELYIVNDIKEIYSSQGQTVNAKHIELIVRQMFSKVRITNAGDSTFFPGDIVDIIRFSKENRELRATGQKEAIGVQMLLGLTKISLFTESWLSAASFQETVRVLVDASTSRKIDHLEGLKENVIIGRLIPTLGYFENNRDVGEFFSHESDDQGSDFTDDHFEITTASTSLV
jgi:DNA-directed RNA polymerase subunit beta'